MAGSFCFLLRMKSILLVVRLNRPRDSLIRQENLGARPKGLPSSGVKAHNPLGFVLAGFTDVLPVYQFESFM